MGNSGLDWSASWENCLVQVDRRSTINASALAAPTMSPVSGTIHIIPLVKNGEIELAPVSLSISFARSGAWPTLPASIVRVLCLIF